MKREAEGKQGDDVVIVKLVEDMFGCEENEGKWKGKCEKMRLFVSC